MIYVKWQHNDNFSAPCGDLLQDIYIRVIILIDFFIYSVKFCPQFLQMAYLRHFAPIKEAENCMKRFSPYAVYQINGKKQYASIAPDGEKIVSTDWTGDRLKEIRSIFNRYKLKEHQPEIIKSILSGNDTFVILPTGGGKSLCFQAPSVFFPGITLVITPLTALIENQVHNFNDNSYPVYHAKGENYYQTVRFKSIYPGMDGLSPQAMFSEILNPHESSGQGRKIQYKLLYVSPERLCNPKFIRALYDAEQNGLRINYIVIDEVHCMSQWGFEFRESYLYIADFISRRPIRPIISAFTATATSKDIEEIKSILHFPVDEKDYSDKKYKEFFDLYKRRNLSLNVIPCSNGSDAENAHDEGGAPVFPKTRLSTLIGILEKNIDRICIIYRTTVSGVDELYNALKNNKLFEERLVKYHARMQAPSKARSQKLFLNSYDGSIGHNKSTVSSTPCKNIMIATKAFGMGIDKGDISLVIHYDMPRSLEDYYQEVGRAGRDEDKVPEADCYLLYSEGPAKEKGTLQYTRSWIASQRGLPSSGCMPLASQFSDELKENIYKRFKIRLECVKAYCDFVQKNPDEAHEYIVDYLSGASDLDDPATRQSDSQPERYLAELKRLVSEINELHINNTHVANLLRHKPDTYELNRPFILHEDPSDSVTQAHELTFTVHGDEKLSYFDMCVLDAIYSIEILQKDTIYVQTILEALTGKNPRCSSQNKRDFRTKIKNSIDKMRHIAISISDHQCDLEIKEETFLPLKDKPKGQKGYSYSAIPPLFLYAEKMNGKIIRVPVSLLNVSKIRKHAFSLGASISNALLCHYLVHRIAISKRSKRGSFILFSTIKSIIGIQEDSCLFHKKAAAILNHYQEIGYFYKYYLYIKDYKYRFTGGKALTDTAYFQVKTADPAEDPNFRDSSHPLLPDITVVWDSQYNALPNDINANFHIKKKLPDAVWEGCRLSQDTQKALAAVSPGRMDGIVLLQGQDASG